MSDSGLAKLLSDIFSVSLHSIEDIFIPFSPLELIKNEI